MLEGFSCLFYYQWKIRLCAQENGKKWCMNFISICRRGVCPLFGTHNTSFYPDKCAAREIRQLMVACENKENGCTWSDILGNYEVKKN